MNITKQPEKTRRIGGSHFASFFCIDDNEYHTLGEVIREYEKDRLYPRFFGKMRCPECFEAILIFNAGGTNMHGTKIRPHLKTKKDSQHGSSCMFGQPRIDIETLEQIAGQISKDKADSMMSAQMNRLFRRDGYQNGYQTIHETEDTRDEVSSAGSKGKTLRLHSKSLNAELSDKQHNIPMVFSGKVRLETFKPNKQKEYFLLAIKPFPSGMHSQACQIYLGGEKSIIDTTAVYYLVALARAEKTKDQYPRINLAPIGDTRITFHIHEQIIDQK
jgi:hypothetical protein